MSEAVKKPIYKKWWFWLVVVLVVLAIVGGSGEKKPAEPEIALPQDQTAFLVAVQKAQTEAKSAANDMQKGGIKSTRDTEICSILKSREIVDWVGKVRKIDANSDGKGVVEIEIADDIIVKTWNNALSDIIHKTLMEPGSEQFNAFSALKPGQQIRFSGNFFKGLNGDCIAEGSLTLDGKIKEPEFIVKFNSVTAM